MSSFFILQGMLLFIWPVCGMFWRFLGWSVLLYFVVGRYPVMQRKNQREWRFCIIILFLFHCTRQERYRLSTRATYGKTSWTQNLITSMVFNEILKTIFRSLFRPQASLPAGRLSVGKQERVISHLSQTNESFSLMLFPYFLRAQTGKFLCLYLITYSLFFNFFSSYRHRESYCVYIYIFFLMIFRNSWTGTHFPYPLRCANIEPNIFLCPLFNQQC